MPADVTGTTIVVEGDGGREFTFRKGPIFSRSFWRMRSIALPKTQSSLLEAMQEKSVTVGGQTHVLDKPFFVMATQNPVEQENLSASRSTAGPILLQARGWLLDPRGNERNPR